MLKYPVPPVPELARAAGGTVEEMFGWWLTYYDRDPAPFNYVRGTKIIRASYGGLHNLPLLLAGCAAEKIEQSRKSNSEIVALAAPLAFDRQTQVFDLPRRRFPFGRNLQAAYRIPFFFVENGAVKLYHLQPRKSASVSFEQMSMVATIYKRFILDTEFYGQSVDVEIVDLAGDPDTKARAVHRYALNDLELWSEQQLQDRLTLIAESLDRVWNSGLIKPRDRKGRRPDPDMPLFD
jgi:hypothetical protein